MQFIVHGPEVPHELLRAQEEDRLVFFCGAGISRPAGLPNFKGLVDTLYKYRQIEKTPLEKQLCRSGRLDSVIEQLDRRTIGGKLAIRKVLAEILKVNPNDPAKWKTHRSLIKLATSRSGGIRLITTNFDRLFLYALKELNQKSTLHVAPLLPVPKRTKWKGIVHLHGLLPDEPDDTAFQNIIVSSADFGSAYLQERWASRFISEVFRNYTVCFIGYSVEDPVLRYLVDAIAADRRDGEPVPRVFAFAGIERKTYKQTLELWEAKNIIPILYKTKNGHAALNETLHEWAKIWQDGTLGKANIVVRLAQSHPTKSTAQDKFVERMVWALSDPSGFPAQQFAEYKPTPPVEWLDAFAAKRFLKSDFASTDDQGGAEDKRVPIYSLIQRPSSSLFYTSVDVTSESTIFRKLDKINFCIATWLCRHVDSVHLTMWIVENGGLAHPQLKQLIRRTLAERCKPEAADKLETSLGKFWEFFLADMTRSRFRNMTSYQWIEDFQAFGLTTSIRKGLEEILAPAIEVRRPMPYEEAQQGVTRKLVFEVHAASDYLRSLIDEQRKPQFAQLWEKNSITLLYIFEGALIRLLEVQNEWGVNTLEHDSALYAMPSIEHHEQNGIVDDWHVLIEIIRDTWKTVERLDREQATAFAARWVKLPFLTFRRLGLFAAAQGGLPSETWWKLLHTDHDGWIWERNLWREVARLLVKQGSTLSTDAADRLQQCILQGPPRHCFAQEKSDSELQEIALQVQWKRLLKLQQGGVPLSSEAAAIVLWVQDKLSSRESKDPERDEFTVWSSSGSNIWQQESTPLPPHTREGLLDWIRKHQPPTEWYRDDGWGAVCHRRPALAAHVLTLLAQEGAWPKERWQQALRVWSEKPHAIRMWEHFGEVVASAPDKELKDLAGGLCMWMQAGATTTKGYQLALTLIDRIFRISFDEDRKADDPLTHALNHPIGKAAEVLFRIWFDRSLEDGAGIDCGLKPYFDRLADFRLPLKPGRVFLGAHAIALFRVDPEWFKAHLLPLFDWKVDEDEALGLWCGFLWAPRLYVPFLSVVKNHLLATIKRSDKLGRSEEILASFFTFAVLDHHAIFDATSVAAAFEKLRGEALAHCAHVLVRELEAIERADRLNNWAERIKPFLLRYWPKDRDRMSKEITVAFARLCIAADAAFSDALDTLSPWLEVTKPSDFDLIYHLLDESGLCTRFPKEALRLINFGPVRLPWRNPKLNDCLSQMETALPEIRNDPIWQKWHTMA